MDDDGTVKIELINMSLQNVSINLLARSIKKLIHCPLTTYLSYTIKICFTKKKTTTDNLNNIHNYFFVT